MPTRYIWITVIDSESLARQREGYWRDAWEKEGTILDQARYPQFSVDDQGRVLNALKSVSPVPDGVIFNSAGREFHRGCQVSFKVESESNFVAESLAHEIMASCNKAFAALELRAVDCHCPS